MGLGMYCCYVCHKKQEGHMQLVVDLDKAVISANVWV